MKEFYNSGVTPQQKLIAVNSKFGNTGIQSQQGTSRIIYDTLVVGTNTTFRFFEDASSRVFPFTNTGSDGNKLGVGDTMVVESLEFIVYTRPIGATKLTFFSGLISQTYALSLIDFDIANNKVLKRVTLTESLSNYNKNVSPRSTDLELETQIVIPPLLPFVLELRLPTAYLTPPVGFEYLIQAQLIGTGGIIAPRTTF